MKHIHVFTFFLMSFFYSSCGQNHTQAPKHTLKPNSAGYSESQLIEADTSKVPMSMVRKVKKARNGDILIASYLGVFRYDGTSFTNISGKTIPTRIASFWDVLEDRNGNLWFGTKDSGVYYYPSASLRAGGKSFQHFTTRNGLASNMALHIYEDRAGNIWVGASRYDGTSFQNFSTNDGFPSNRIRLLLEDKTGKLWFGAQAEDMFVYDGKTFTVPKNKDGRAFNNVWSVIEDRKGNIWFGATIIEDKRGDTSFVSQGLWRYDPSTSLTGGGSAYTKVSNKGAYAIIEDKNGNIWTSGEVNRNPIVWALSRYDAKSLYDKTPTVKEIMSQSGMLLGILEDAKGNIWIGSGVGVYRYDGKTITDFKSVAGQQ